MSAALVISDTHFGAWAGRDLLREELFLERLAPQLDGIDELIFLGDLFDFLFGSVGDAVDVSDGLLRLIAEKLPGKRLVFLVGNHDHQVEIAYPTWGAIWPTEDATPRRVRRRQACAGGSRSALGFAGVLCTPGHYLDLHARLAGSRGDRLLTRTVWGIATGGPEQPKTIEDCESVITLLPQRGLRSLCGEQPGSEVPQARPVFPAAGAVSPSDPSEHALEAFPQVVENLDWGEPEPRLVELLADLNPLRGGPSLPVA